MTDKSLGALILIFGIVGATIYMYWLFAPAAETDLLFYVPTLKMRWAIVLPVLGVVLALFFLAIWIGWTMAVTPPPVINKPNPQNEKDQKSSSIS